MGLLKKKNILTTSDFAYESDPFRADNMQLKSQIKDEIPSKSEDVRISRNQSVYFAVNRVLNKLLANDKYIRKYLENLEKTTISKDLAIKAFLQDVDDLETSYYETAFALHYDTHHKKGPGITTYDGKHILLGVIQNQYMHNDFGNLDTDGAKLNFIKEEYLDNGYTYHLSQDILVNCEFDDSENVNYPTNYVNVKVMNQLTNGKFSNVVSDLSTSEIASLLPSTYTSKYIYKEWLSGIKELYIYIPSTFTFYNENLGDTGNTPHDNRTYIKVVINRRHFKFNNIYNMQICGQSFPLQISISDSANDEKKYFNDCILPSLVRTMCISDSLTSNIQSVYDEGTNQITLYFCCCGTDAQAILIFGD